MKISQFNNLTSTEKGWFIYKFGSFLVSVEYYCRRMNLYSMNDLFIELLQPIGRRQIERIQVANDNGLDKYLNRIALEKPLKETKHYYHELLFKKTEITFSGRS